MMPPNPTMQPTTSCREFNTLPQPQAAPHTLANRQNFGGMAVGIGETTLHSWREEHPEIERQLEEARELCCKKALARIKAAGEAGDWRTSEAFLRMSFPADYRRDASVNVNAIATAQQAGVICDEEMRARLIAPREQVTGRRALPTTSADVEEAQ